MVNSKRIIYIQVFLISAATLILEGTLLRIFSIAEWYHFAFISISVALLGFGISGTYLSISNRLARREAGNGRSSNRVFSFICLLFSIGVAIAYFVINFIPFDSYRIAWEKIQVLYLGLYYLGLCIPFFFSGLCAGLAISSFPEDVNRIYFVNLAGSAMGCLCVIGLLSAFTPSGVILTIYLIGIFAAIIGSVFAGHKVLRYGAGGTCPPCSSGGPARQRISGGKLLRYISLVLLVPVFYILLSPSIPPGVKSLRMSPYKDLSIIRHYPRAKTLYSDSSLSSRVDIIKAPGIKHMPGLSPVYSNPPPEQIGITVDGGNLSGIISERPPEELLCSLATALPYEIGKRRNTLVLEPYTGLDILVALTYGCESIIAVEKDRLIPGAVRKYSDVYDNSRVSLVIDNPRGYLESSKDAFDIIQISLADSFKANFASSYSLNENYKYTKEAISSYFDHLSPGGVLVMLRWLQFPPSEELRVLSALTESIPEPERKIIAIRTYRNCLILAKKTDFSPFEIQTAKKFCSEKRFDFIYFPGIGREDTGRHIQFEEDPYFTGFKEILTGNRKEFYQDYIYNVRPATDDSPFFFHYFRWGNLPAILSNFGRTMQPFGGGGYLVLFVLLFFAIITGAILILLPLKISASRDIRKIARSAGICKIVRSSGIRKKTGTEVKFLLYFLLLGTGYLFVEIPLISKFILITGLPVYAFTVVAFSVLFFSGLGSLLSSRWSTKTRAYLILLLGISTFILVPLLHSSLRLFLSQSFSVRVLLSIGLLAPFAFLMGIPFPLGLKYVNEQNPRLIPWAWAINGYASVIASVLATILAVSSGFSPVLILAGAAYLGAGTIMLVKIQYKIQN